jgi:hypothetical protein
MSAIYLLPGGETWQGNRKALQFQLIQWGVRKSIIVTNDLCCDLGFDIMPTFPTLAKFALIYMHHLNETFVSTACYPS